MSRRQCQVCAAPARRHYLLTRRAHPHTPWRDARAQCPLISALREYTRYSDTMLQMMADGVDFNAETAEIAVQMV